MRFAGYLSTALLGVLVHLSLTANTHKICKHRLSPVAGSWFGKIFPGVLPYEKCSIVDGDRSSSLSTFEISALFGEEISGEYVNLFCYSKHLKVAFKLPIQVASIHFYGLGFGITSKRNFARLRKLDGLYVKDIYGTYSGANGALGSGGFASLNSAHTKGFITIFSSAMIPVRGRLGYLELSILPRKLSAVEKYTDSYLLEVALVQRYRDQGLIDEEEAVRRLEIADKWPQELKYRPSYAYQADHIAAKRADKSLAKLMFKSLSKRRLAKLKSEQRSLALDRLCP